MAKTTKIAVLVLVIAVLIVGLGYAAIQNITLNIAGTAKADASQANTSNTNEEYFKVEYSFDGNKTSLAKGEAATVTVKVTLIKTPVEAQVSSTIGLQITASPVQPQ